MLSEILSAVQTSTDIIANTRQHQAEHAASLHVRIRDRPIRHQQTGYKLFLLIADSLDCKLLSIAGFLLIADALLIADSFLIADSLLIADHGSSAVQTEQGALLLGGSFRQDVAGRGPVPPRSPGAGPRQPHAAAV